MVRPRCGGKGWHIVWRCMTTRERLADMCFERKRTCVRDDDRRGRSSRSSSPKMKRECSVSCELRRDGRDRWNIQRLDRRCGREESTPDWDVSIIQVSSGCEMISRTMSCPEARGVFIVALH